VKRVETLAERIERMKARPLAFASTPKLVTIHRCFSQLSGDQKRTECACTERVSETEAYHMVSRREADWLIVTRHGKTYNHHGAIVIRQTQEEIFKQRSIEQDKRFNRNILGQIAREHVKWLRTHIFKYGAYPPTMSLTEMQVIDALQDVEAFRRAHPDWPEDYIGRLKEDSLEVVLRSEKLTANRGQFMAGADHGTGQTVSGGNDSGEIASIDAKARPESGENESHGRRVKVANHKPSPGADGQMDYSEGADPGAYIGDIDKNSEQYAEQVETEARERCEWQRKLGKENL